MYTGCVCDQLSWQMARSGLLTATARLVAQGESVAAATAAGTPTSLALQRFGHFNGAITRNGTPLGNVISAEVTYSNGLDRIETIRSDGRIEGADPGMAALTGRVEVRFADTALITQAIDGTPCELVFAWTSAPTPASPSPRMPSTCRALGSRSRPAGHPGHLRLAGGQGHQPRPDVHRRSRQHRRNLLRKPAMLTLDLTNAPQWCDLSREILRPVLGSFE